MNSSDRRVPDSSCTPSAIINAPIFTGTPYADHLGFTKDKFRGYLWDTGDGSIMISLITSVHPGKGNVRNLINGLLSMGYTVKVPTPFARMRYILGRMGFVHTVEDSDLGPCDVWVKSPHGISDNNQTSKP